MDTTNLTIPNTFYRISIKALITNAEGKFLMIQEKNGLRELPGGGLDSGENPQEGLKRELHEEMGLQATSIADHPSYFFTREEDGIRRANAMYDVEIEDFTFVPSEECVALGFFTSQEAKEQKLYPNIATFVELYKVKA